MRSPSLRELQSAFWRSITSTRVDRRLLGLVEPSATLVPAARVGVYADAYLSRLREVLAEDFPRLATILGPDRFTELVRDYLTRHPSTNPSVRHLGRDMARYLAERMDVPPCLADLARLEWARTEVFDAPDSDVLTTDDLRAVPPADWPGLRFAPIPALIVLHADWPVHELWGGADVSQLSASPTVIRVWRDPTDAVFHAGTDAGVATALERLLAGEPFAAVCGVLAEVPPLEAARHATALLARCVEDGLIARVTSLRARKIAASPGWSAPEGHPADSTEPARADRGAGRRATAQPAEKAA